MYFWLSVHRRALFALSARGAISEVWTVVAIESGPVHASGSQHALHACRRKAPASDSGGGDYGAQRGTVETGTQLSELHQLRA